MNGRYVYPVLPARRDFLFFRVGGDGLGNCFFVYFRAALLARDLSAKLIAPAWCSFRLGTILRRERSARFYIGLFQPGPFELGGVNKFVAYCAARLNARKVNFRKGDSCPADGGSSLTIVVDAPYTFDELAEDREWVRQRIKAIAKEPLDAVTKWGNGSYIAVHVRCGDFLNLDLDELLSGKRTGLRIPLSWYKLVLSRLRTSFPDTPIHICSDASESDLAELLAIPLTNVVRTGSDLLDMFMLAGGKILVGSLSTYSQWAAYLGGMPAIWLDTILPPEVPNGNIVVLAGIDGASKSWDCLNGIKFGV